MSKEIVLNQEKKKSLTNSKKGIKNSLFLWGTLAVFSCAVIATLVFFLLSNFSHTTLSKEEFESFCEKNSGKFTAQEAQKSIYGDDLSGVYICNDPSGEYRVTLSVFKRNFEEIPSLEGTISELKNPNSAGSFETLKDSKNYLKYRKKVEPEEKQIVGVYYKNTFLQLTSTSQEKIDEFLSSLKY